MWVVPVERATMMLVCCGLFLWNCYVAAKMFCLLFSQLPQCRLSRSEDQLQLHRQSCECWVHKVSNIPHFISSPQARSRHLSHPSPSSDSPLWTHPSCSPSDSSETSPGSCWSWEIIPDNHTKHTPLVWTKNPWLDDWWCILNVQREIINNSSTMAIQKWHTRKEMQQQMSGRRKRYFVCQKLYNQSAL